MSCQEPGLPAGDVIIVLDEQKHNQFVRQVRVGRSSMRVEDCVRDDDKYNLESKGKHASQPGDSLQKANLIMEEAIELSEALCGFTRQLTTLDGRKIHYTTVPGEAVWHMVDFSAWV